jgi:hypothetical protein
MVGGGTTRTLLRRLALVLGVAAIYGLFLTWHPVPHRVVLGVDGIMTFGGLILAGGLAIGPRPWRWLHVGRSPNRVPGLQPTAQWAPVFLALSALCSAIVVVLLLSIGAPDAVTGNESAAYAGMLINYPLMLACALLLPRQQMSVAARARRA